MEHNNIPYEDEFGENEAEYLRRVQERRARNVNNNENSEGSHYQLFTPYENDQDHVMSNGLFNRLIFQKASQYFNNNIPSGFRLVIILIIAILLGLLVVFLLFPDPAPIFM